MLSQEQFCFAFIHSGCFNFTFSISPFLHQQVGATPVLFPSKSHFSAELLCLATKALPSQLMKRVFPISLLLNLLTESLGEWWILQMIYRSLLHKFLHILPCPHTTTISHLSQQKSKSFSLGSARRMLLWVSPALLYSLCAQQQLQVGLDTKGGHSGVLLPTHSWFLQAAFIPLLGSQKVGQKKSAINQADMGCGEDLVNAIFHLKACN